MLDINFIRQNLEEVKKGVEAKQLDPRSVNRVLDLDDQRRALIKEIEELRAKRNEIAHKGKSSEEGKKVKEILKEKEPELQKIEAEYKEALFELPNLPAPDVKIGKNDTENEVIRKWGKIPKFGFEPKDHLILGENLGIIDAQRAVKVSGARFTYLKGDAVLLEFALVQFVMETLLRESFIPVVPPVLIRKESMRAMGYMEHGGEEDMYVLDKDDLILVGTSEQAIGPMHMGETFDAKSLPLRYAGFSSCFRREAGSYGKDTRGILRLHQFDKVEMFSYVTPEESDHEHEFLLSIEEKFLQALGIPYQVVKMCSGDLGLPASRKYDLEAWIPSQGKYRELTSTSTVTDFQARRLNIKYQDGDKKEYVHMLNGTGLAIGRTIVAIVENYQQKDGSVKIPKVLQKWMGTDKITKRA